MKRSLFALFSILGFFGSAVAGPLEIRPVAPAAITPSPVFSDEQFFTDLYGNYVNRTGNMSDCGCMDSNGDKMHGFGGGISFGYFLVPAYIALRADASFSSVNEAQTEIAADLMLRLPLLEGRLAPYALLGGGVETVDGTSGFLHVGGGLEWRFTPNLGIFAEVTYAWVENLDKNENLTAKVGMRVAY
jgi:hypothetical protein